MQHPCSAFKNAAERVKGFFSQYCIFLPKNYSQAVLHSHHCNLIKLPKFCSKAASLSLQGYALKKGKKNTDASKKITPMGQLKHLQLQSHLFHQETANSLKSQRVQKYRLRELQIAEKRLKKLKETKPVSHKEMRQISLMQEEALPSKKQDDSLEQWEALIRSKEERQFHLTRITKFFID